MDFIDLEALGRYVRDCQQKMQSLSEEVANCRRQVADRNAQIRELQAILLRNGMITYPERQQIAKLRRFPR